MTNRKKNFNTIDGTVGYGTTYGERSFNSKPYKQRARWEIIQDMLKAIQEEGKAKKTRIMQRAYLDWRNFEKYLDFLLAEDFISKCDLDAYYELTVKGKEMLRRLKEVDNFFDN